MPLYTSYLKRVIDFIIALFALFLLIPVFITITLLLVIANRGTPFFTQRRPGKREKTFLLIKFRTMNNQKDSEGKLLPDEKRITRVGHFIRKSSLDEIPQLFNVLKGDMSLVGPRPLLMEYLPLYSERQRRRHEVRPGITGWAQVNGRNAISWEQKFDFDVWYVENVSLALDIKICIRTFKKILKSEGISQQGHATMPVFKGVEQ